MFNLNYRALFESAPSPFLVLTPTLKIVGVNEAYLRATMTSRDQILGRDIFEVFPDNPLDPEATGVRNLRASLERVLSTAAVDVMAVQRYDIARPESLGGGFEQRFWSPVNSPVLDDRGRVINIIHRVEDVTPYVVLQEQLRHQTADTEEQRSRADHMTSEVLARSLQLGEANRQLTSANKGLLALYHSVSEMVAQADAELQLRPQPDSNSDLSRSTPSQHNLAEADPDEVLAQISRLIVGHKRLEEELLQAQKMEAIGRCAGGIAHDFNNLLTIILGSCNLLLSRLRVDDPLTHRLEEIRIAGEKGAELTRQLLVFSRHHVFEPQNVEMAASLQELDRMIRRVIGADVEVETTIDPNTGSVRIDPSQVQQVVVNLAVNARDAMPDGGRLTIDLRSIHIPDGSYSEITPGQYIGLTIADTGIGMTPAVRQRAFEPFFTTKEAGTGTGLGLSTVYGIVKQAGGHILLDTEPGLGTAFRILLPRQPEAPADQPAPSAVELSTQPATETILVVEDDEILRQLIGDMLRPRGYTVYDAANGPEALQFCATHPDPIHLLLTDIVLPKMRGHEVAARAVQLHPELRVLFMSGYTGSTGTTQELESGQEFLAKPFTANQLSARIRQVLGNPTARSLRVLVVDDMPEVLSLLQEMLAAAGIQVITASNGREAAEKVDERTDVLLTDLSMPEVEGIETIVTLRRSYPKLKIIAMSGAFGPDILGIAKRLGADAALAKPLDPATVIACIRAQTGTEPSFAAVPEV